MNQAEHRKIHCLPFFNAHAVLNTCNRNICYRNFGRMKGKPSQSAFIVYRLITKPLVLCLNLGTLKTDKSTEKLPGLHCSNSSASKYDVEKHKYAGTNTTVKIPGARCFR